MFISREEIEHLKEQAEERVRPIIGEEFIYYHAVGKPGHPTVDYGICGSEVVIAGFRYAEDEESPYDVDLAIPTRTDGLFVLMSNVKVESAYAQLEGEQKVVFVEYEHREFIQTAVSAWVKSLMPVQKKPSHLSLVVDNVNTVESLLAPVEDAPYGAADIIKALQQHVGQRFMPTSKLKTFGGQRAPEYLKSADDGDFMSTLLAAERSQLYKRDALRSEEVWAVLAMENFNIIVGLKGLQIFFGPRGSNRARLMHWGEDYHILSKQDLYQAIGEL